MFEFYDVKYKDVLDLPKLEIKQEEITTFIGASGSGKTTILRMLNKLISPTQGRIIFNGTDLRQINSVAHRRTVSMLSQSPAIFDGSIRDNLNVGLRFQERELARDKDLNHILEQVKLNKPLEASANTLSGGEKQRLALGRILLLNSKVYLLDEPSSALDDETEEMIIQMLTEHVKREKKTIVMVTHSKAIAEKYSDTIIEISKGRCLTWRCNDERNN
ncbi:sulfate/thiosulfate import ATP-binding protein CysA [Desulfosporosinus acididurans]|uniref:Sulfate/thiosulfate import ATP-binding protein CysA n=1 Tax=Desulfosporosinus acididurans TaxID=476652 RepID=A0A0J1FJN0_9FIRM|nr:ABC transporter ATP-binding protein [Desulfosporosinus acididurans]KLU63632.1 sulfate/thiosulfate import ATP-binding protein CysA [Desulfosporosinus acididurans]